MTYILCTIHGEFEQTRTFATASDAVAAIDTAEPSPTAVVSIDKMGETITEAALRQDARHEGSRESLHLSEVNS